MSNSRKKNKKSKKATTTPNVNPAETAQKNSSLKKQGLFKPVFQESDLFEGAFTMNLSSLGSSFNLSSLITNFVPLPKDVQCMKALLYRDGEPLDDPGKCHGKTHMGVQAILAEDMPTYDRRMELIKKMSVDSFKKTIEETQMKRALLVKKVKDKIKLLSKEEIANKKTKMANDEKVMKKIKALEKTMEALIKENKYDEKEASAEFAIRKDSLLMNAYVQKKINKEVQRSCSPDEAIQLEILGLFDGTELYQESYLYPEYFPKGEAPFSQNSLRTSPLTLSIKLEEAGGIVRLNQFSFSGTYSWQKAVAYLQSFEKAISSIANKPIALVLTSINHTIVISYSVKESKWVFINHRLGEPEESQRLSTQQLAKKLVDTLSANQTAIFSTEFFVNKLDETMVSECLTAWQSQEGWKAMHTVTRDNAKETDSLKSSWLCIAAKIGDLKKVKELLAEKADPNQQSDNGATPLFAAVQEGHFEVVKELIEAKANINHLCYPDKNPTSLLYIAAQNGYLDIVKLLLKQPNINLNVGRIKNGASPLYIAAGNGHTEIVKALLENKADPNKALTEDGFTPLCVAVTQGHVDIVKLLLEAKVNPNISSAKGFGLLNAVEKRNIKIAELFLNAKVDVNIMSSTCTTAIYLAAQNRDLEMAKLLLKFNANLNLARKDNGATPLFIAAQNGDIEMVKLLLEAGADATLSLKTNADALGAFAKRNQVEKGMEKVILKQKNSAVIFVTPEEIAQVMGHTSVVTLLQQKKLTLRN